MIKFIEEQDINDVLILGQDLYKESEVFNKYKYNNEKFKSFLEMITKDPYHCGILAYRKDKLIGIILGCVSEIFFSKDRILEEYVVFVDKKYRGSKFVFKMMNLWIDWGASHNVKDAWIYHTSGIGTDKFFKHIGFNEIGTVLRRK